MSIIQSQWDDGLTSYVYAPCKDFTDIADQAKEEYLGPSFQKLYDLRDYILSNLKLEN